MTEASIRLSGSIVAGEPPSGVSDCLSDRTWRSVGL